MPKAMRTRDRLNAVMDAEINEASVFVVNFFLGRQVGDPIVSRDKLYERHEFHVAAYPTRSDALRAARALVAERGPDPYGRSGVIYAVCRSSEISNFVDRHFELAVDGGRRPQEGYV